MNDLLIKGPDGSTYRSSLSSNYFAIEVSSPAATVGSWLISSSSSMISGYYWDSKIERFGESLVFYSKMNDVGEEYILLSHKYGTTVISIRLSPAKCSIETYHRYLENYLELVEIPSPGVRSVSGAIGGGRKANNEEKAYLIIELLRLCVESAIDVRRDIARHPKGGGGYSGIDAQKTLSGWRQNPEWYTVSELPKIKSLSIGDKYIRPIRICRKESVEYNYYIGSVLTFLTHLSKKIPHTPLGSLAHYYIYEIKSKISRLDMPAEVDFISARKFLHGQNLPPRSKNLADLLIKLEDLLTSSAFVIPSLVGLMPFYLAPPEIIFQSYSVMQILRALGATESARNILESARSESGYRFGDYVVWIDTVSHSLNGWRDGSASPSLYKPDLIIINSRENKLLLADVKFRHSNENGKISSQSSIKDIQAYMQEYGLKKSVILSPTADGDPEIEEIRGGPYLITGIPIPVEANAVAQNSLRVKLSSCWNTQRP